MLLFAGLCFILLLPQFSFNECISTYKHLIRVNDRGTILLYDLEGKDNHILSNKFISSSISSRDSIIFTSFVFCSQCILACTRKACSREGVANPVPEGTESPAVSISVVRRPVLKIDLTTNYHCLKFD